MNARHIVMYLNAIVFCGMVAWEAYAVLDKSSGDTWCESWRRLNYNSGWLFFLIVQAIVIHAFFGPFFPSYPHEKKWRDAAEVQRHTDTRQRDQQ